MKEQRHHLVPAPALPSSSWASAPTPISPLYPVATSSAREEAGLSLLSHWAGELMKTPRRAEVA